MTGINREAVFSKLNPLAYRALESAYQFARTRGDAYVELHHWLKQILMLPDSDLTRIVRAFGIDHARLAADMDKALEQIRRGGTALLDFSHHIDLAVERGWIAASLWHGAQRIRTAHLMIGILDEETLQRALFAISPQFRQIRLEELRTELGTITEGSPEATATDQAPAAQPAAESGTLAPAPMGKQEALRRFTVDLTDEARAGRIDPVIGRDEEIRQVVDILMRRRQNNPILVGEAGVGKTAVVEGFAFRIAAGDVPPPLRDVRLKTLDVGLLQAGASMKGEFEQRLKQVIEEVQSSPQPIILFIDEAHTLVGAGGAAGTGDAANLLKPALARGTLRTIAATTWGEYKEHIETDPALTRRFQTVQVEEPDAERALAMMRGIAAMLEAHHGVQVLDEGLEAAVSLSHRYIPARQLPDKSVSVLDTACARVAVGQSAVPAELEQCRRRIEALETELAIITRERDLGVDVAAREAAARDKLAAEETQRAELEQRWEQEKALVEEILALRRTLQDGTGDGSGARADVAELVRLQAELAALQGDRPLILPSVDAQAVASVIASWTGVPVGRMVKNEIEAVLAMDDALKRRIIGQDHALEMVARRIQTSRAGLDNPNKPIGVFLLCGPSGVGKTETALALAELLYGGEENVIGINMSEFQEAHTVSTLKGAPPGYKGYGKGGRLTEAVRRRPYSVVLLDEVEKAHPDVHEIFFQVFDKGVMEDSEGRRIDFKNTLILLTSNVGTDLIMNMCADPELLPTPEGLSEALRAPLLKVFPAALLGRLVVIPYYPLSTATLDRIVHLQLERIRRRVDEHHKIPFEYDDAVVELIRKRCTEVESGGRMIDAILTNTVLPQVSQEFLRRTLQGQPIGRVRVSADENGFTYAFA
jgi:type VI secretion system protein VasG